MDCVYDTGELGRFKLEWLLVFLTNNLHLVIPVLKRPKGMST
jgi:hypothetical protein